MANLYNELISFIHPYLCNEYKCIYISDVIRWMKTKGYIYMHFVD